MNYKRAWGSPQAFFVPKTRQKRVNLGGKLPLGLPQDFQFPPKKVIVQTNNKGTNPTRSVPL